jgi:hypothetical protein
MESVIGHSTLISNVEAPDIADLMYGVALYLLLLSHSSTRRTEQIRVVVVLNLAQVALATVLAYFLLFRKVASIVQVETALQNLYSVICLLLVLSTALRLMVWSSEEEKRRLLLLCKAIALYVPVEIGMNYASVHWRMQRGTLFDLFWSVPYVYATWMVLKMPPPRSPADGEPEPDALDHWHLWTCSLSGGPVPCTFFGVNSAVALDPVTAWC